MLEEQDIRFDEVWERFRHMVASIMRKLNIPLSDEDAWQEARIAVWEALNRFDPNRGGLSTLCYRYVFNALVDHRYTRNFGIPYPRHMYQLKEKVRMPVVVSLDERLPAKFTDSDPETLKDVIPDKSQDIDMVIHRLWCLEFMDCIRQELSDVDKDDYTMLRMWFGLDGEDRFSLHEIGDRFGMTHEAVRMRIHKLLNRLRRSERLAKFIGEEVDPCIPA